MNSTDTVIALLGGALRTTPGPVTVYHVDRDGQPDLLVTAWEHYAATKTYLFLSGHAKPGAIVGCAAIVENAGC